MPVSDPHLYEWLVLRRVHDGGTAKSAGNYYDGGMSIPEYLTRMLDYLVRTGLVGVAAGDPVWEIRRLSLTEAGAVRYAELCEKRDPLRAPSPEHGKQSREGTP